MSNFRNNYGIWYILYLIVASWLPESRHMHFAEKIRNFFAQRIMRECSPSANIERYARFNKQCCIGEKSSIGVSCEIYGPVEIGKNVMMGPECIIYTSGHEHSRTDIPMILQGSTEVKKVVIKDDVWIGRRVIIMPGITIEEGCIIGANAVVTKDTLPYSIYAGVPAKKVKERD